MTTPSPVDSQSSSALPKVWFEAFLERGLGGLAALLLFAMMLLTFVDVIGRYVFSQPIPGGFEITEIMLATLIFLGLPLVTAENGHVTVDLLDSVIPDFFKPVQTVFVNLISFGAVSVMAHRMWDHAFKVQAYGDTTAILRIPYTPLAFLMAVMVTLTALVLLVIAIAPAGKMFRSRFKSLEGDN